MRQDKTLEFAERLELIEKLVRDFYYVEYEAFGYTTDTERIKRWEIKDRIHALMISEDFKPRINGTEREEDIAIDLCNRLICEYSNKEELK